MILLLRGTPNARFRVHRAQGGRWAKLDRVRRGRSPQSAAGGPRAPDGMVGHLGPALLARVST